MPSKPNAYSLFVKDSFNRMKREGKNPKFNSLFKDLGPTWSSMSDAQKQTYKDRAKNPSCNNWSNNAAKPGSQSNPVSHVLPEKCSPSTSQPASSSQTKHNPQMDTKPDLKPIIMDLVERKADAKRSYDEIDWDDDDTERMNQNEKKVKLGIPNHWRARQVAPERYEDIHLVKIRESCKAIIAARADKVTTMPLYAFSANVLCSKKLDDGKRIFVPIEIGICAYSLKAGRLGQPYHVMIDAGQPPIGCINPAADHAKDTHRITIPPSDSYPEEARNDYRKIYKEITDYTKAGERTILVWNAREMQQIVGCLEWLHEKANQQMGLGRLAKPSTWTVLPIVEFTANMCNFVQQNMLGHKEPTFVIHYYINVLLECSLYDYERRLMCSYHKCVESKWCAKSCATRMFLCIERVFDEIKKHVN